MIYLTYINQVPSSLLQSLLLIETGKNLNEKEIARTLQIPLLPKTLPKLFMFNIFFRIETAAFSTFLSYAKG